MLTTYIRLALRTFSKNKTAFIINLLGMSIALACCITAYINYQFNAGFDRGQVNMDHVYRVSFFQEVEGKQIHYGVTPMPMPELIRENMQEADQVVRYSSKDGMFRIGDEMFKKELVYADPAFTKLFTIELMSGSWDLNNKKAVLISDKLARTYFNSTDVVGKALTQIVRGEPREFVIGGIYKAFPSNSSFRFDLLTAFTNAYPDPLEQNEAEHDWKKWTTTFLEVKNPEAIARLTKQLQQYVKTQNEAREDLKVSEFYIEPFKGMALRAVKERKAGHWMNMAMPPAAVIAPFVMAGFLLLVACFNFTNNCIAVAGKRLKEIGIRKVIGGRRKEIIIQFLAEGALFCMIALLFALFLAEFFVAGWDAMWPSIELNVSYLDNIPLLVAITILMLFTALLAGSYPAFYISSFGPIEVLKGTTRFGGTNLLTKSLLIFQFSISTAAVIFAIAFYNNSKYQKNFDLGYSYQNVVQVPVENESQFIQLRNALANNRSINAIGGSENHIYSSSYKAAANVAEKKKEIDVLNIGDGYFKAVNVRVVAGRGFHQEGETDSRESLIVNEEFVRFFGMKDAVGKRVMLNDTANYYIVGVVKDVYLKALFQPLTPMAFRYVKPSSYKYLVASTDRENLIQTNEEIRSAWRRLFPNMLYTGRLMEADMVMAMEHFDNVVILYTFLGIVAILMSVSGLFSLVSINLQKRTKELGVRKILGAPLANLIMQASKLFLIVMVIAFFIGSLGGSLMVNAMMDGIWEYYVAINAGVISLAVMILFAIAGLAVGFRIFKVIVTNASESLRHE
jgi:putative ABC transport system permease protein